MSLRVVTAGFLLKFLEKRREGGIMESYVKGFLSPLIEEFPFLPLFPIFFWVLLFPLFHVTKTKERSSIV